jgi:hypothetical protein
MTGKHKQALLDAIGNHRDIPRAATCKALFDRRLPAFIGG